MRSRAWLTFNVRQKSMAYFVDLSSYRYGSRTQPGVIHIGWLDAAHEFAKGSVAAALIAKMKQKAARPVELYRGFHVCEWCGQKEARGCGEIRVVRDEVTFAAPVLIVHYIEAHGYLPPAAFLRALEEEPNQSLEPTTMLGTSAAEQPLVPSIVVAHL